MKLNKILLALGLCFTLFTSSVASAQALSSDSRTEVADVLTRIVAREILGGYVKVDRTKVAGDKLEIYASIGLSYYPFREENIQAMYDSVRMVLPDKFAKYKLSLITDNHRIEELVPLYHRTSLKGGVRFTNTSDKPLVKPLSKQFSATEGLAGRHIALWQSHGRYFEQDENLWR